MDRARESGFKALVALRGTTAITLARNFKPKAITLDVRLPDMSGWTVLDNLKHDPATRHIPVHVLSGSDTARDGFTLGAMTCSEKASPDDVLAAVFERVRQSVEPGSKKLLVVAGSEAMRKEICEFLATPGLELVQATSAAAALDRLNSERPDGIVVDWAVSNEGDVRFIEEIQRRLDPAIPPVIVLGAARLDSSLGRELTRCCRISAIRYVQSLERLLDEAVLLLHLPEERLTIAQKKMLATVRQIDPALAGKKILVVDDDLRNIFALTSVLEQHDMQVLHAETGRAGIHVLEKEKDIDLILMDIMMPEMDGYETTKAIRRMPTFGSIPIIALTAKAMKGDREKCLQAGASDYVTKPVDLGYLFSVMRVWLAGLASVAEAAGASGAERSNVGTV